MTDRIYYLEIETTDGSPPQQLFFIELADLTRELTWWHEATHLKSLRVAVLDNATQVRYAGASHRRTVEGSYMKNSPFSCGRDQALQAAIGPARHPNPTSRHPCLPTTTTGDA